MKKAIWEHADLDGNVITKEVIILGFVNYNGNTKAVCQCDNRLVEIRISELLIAE